LEKIMKAVEAIQAKCDITPRIALILGSGLGHFAERVENSVVIPYGEIPGFHASTAIGHAGNLVLGQVSGVDVVVMNGRIHCYEGHDMGEVAFPIRVLKFLGAENLIITNAAGGINETFAPGDLMLITDHINLSGRNPLTGPNDDRIGVRFPSMCHAYSPELREIAYKLAKDMNINIKSGVYLHTSGPSYETPAEIRMMRVMGADAVGMSTVPEVIVAVHAGMKVLGISCISNLAAGMTDGELDQQEVIDTANSIKVAFTGLIEKIVEKI
jgi:purine-nucleoside phosphorylase